MTLGLVYPQLEQVHVSSSALIVFEHRVHFGPTGADGRAFSAAGYSVGVGNSVEMYAFPSGPMAMESFSSSPGMMHSQPGFQVL